MTKPEIRIKPEARMTNVETGQNTNGSVFVSNFELRTSFENSSFVSDFSFPRLPSVPLRAKASPRSPRHCPQSAWTPRVERDKIRCRGFGWPVGDNWHPAAFAKKLLPRTQLLFRMKCRPLARRSSGLVLLLPPGSGGLRLMSREPHSDMNATFLSDALTSEYGNG
jgi:hypothetical protein